MPIERKTQADFEQLKHEIDLPSYASALGYKLDNKKSTQSSLVMLSDGDKVVISRKNGVWVYFSVYDDGDNGTIIDFVKNRTRKTLFEIVVHLSRWIGVSLQPSTHCHTRLKRDPQYDPDRIQNIFKRCIPISSHPYLERRGILSGILDTYRLRGRVFQDVYGNVVFPHWKFGAVCGLELRNTDLKLFVRGSQKLFWRSRALQFDTTLILSESPIDALSYAILHPLKNAFLVSTSGGLSPAQMDALQNFISAKTLIDTILIVTDEDPGGDKIAARLFEAIRLGGFKGVLDRHSPARRGQDWNDVLCLNQRY